jgi:Tetratricopeptide Repeats-Sensor
VADYATAAASLPTVAHGLIRLMQDSSQWTESIAFIEKLPRRIRELPLTRELSALALGKAKRHRDSIGALLELITLKGATSEREGLLGGRFKDLYRAETDPGKKRGLLQDAIRYYELGMTVDLNDYYPSCNLPRLYRRRNAEGDEERARTAAYVALAACRRSMDRNPTDDWARPTLMAMAFDAADPALAARILAEIQTQDVARWHLESCINDVVDSLSDPSGNGAISSP